MPAPRPVFFFDCDKTLYEYDFRKRLPALARLGGVSQYRLASRWWSPGLEHRAEAGEWPTAEEYLAAFEEATGARLTLAEWASARRAAMRPISGSIGAIATATTFGTVSLLSNNPSAFGAVFPVIAPEAAALLGDNVLISAGLGVRKPDALLFRRALDRYGAEPEHAFFTDDVAENVEGAEAVGITGHHFTGDTDALVDAIVAFGRRYAEEG